MTHSPVQPDCDSTTPADRRGLWLHRYAVFTACMTLLLIVAGGMVTSTGSGLSVPDWPTTYHQNMFTFPVSKWVGGILYEHGHHLVASTVGFMTIILALWLQFTEPRRWLRMLGWIALLAVIGQGVLGGLTVLFLLPTWISVFHACLAQSFFCIVISIAVFTSRSWKGRAASVVQVGSPVMRIMCVSLVVVVFVQLLLGALMRHTDAGLAVPDFPLAYGQLLPDLGPAAVAEYNQQRAFEDFLPPVTARQIAIHLAHRLGAILVSLVLLATAATTLSDFGSLPMLRRLAALAVGLLIVQISLGAWTVLSGKQPGVATAHVAVGALILATCWIMTLRAYGFLHVVARTNATASVPFRGATTA